MSLLTHCKLNIFYDTTPTTLLNQIHVKLKLEGFVLSRLKALCHYRSECLNDVMLICSVRGKHTSFLNWLVIDMCAP